MATLAPDPILQGGLDALTDLFSVTIDCLVLFGDESMIRAGIDSAGVDASRIEIIGTTELDRHG